MGHSSTNFNMKYEMSFNEAISIARVYKITLFIANFFKPKFFIDKMKIFAM